MFVSLAVRVVAVAELSSVNTVVASSWNKKEEARNVKLSVVGSRD